MIVLSERTCYTCYNARDSQISVKMQNSSLVLGNL